MDTQSHPVVRMADDLRDIEAIAGGVTADDLLGRGWSAEDVAKYAADARRRARRLSHTTVH